MLIFVLFVSAGVLFARVSSLSVSLITFDFNLKLLLEVVLMSFSFKCFFCIILHCYFSNFNVEWNLCTKYVLDIQPREAI